MKIYSLIRNNDELVPIEVEISLSPGLPQIQYLGLPDQAIKESTHRIKSAIRAQGYEFPKSQQVLVNLRPAHLKKNSRGLDLAVAIGVLIESEQIKIEGVPELYVYGELTLRGDVFEPDDLAEDFEGQGISSLWTGQGGQQGTPYNRITLSELKDIHSPEVIMGKKREYQIQRPPFGAELFFSERQAQIIRLIALGEHSCLLAGPAGSGKTTLAKTIHHLLQSPSEEQMHKILKNNRDLPERLTWRPFVQPHHTTSALGLIGGGAPLYKGEVTRANLGVLVLDELLEFHPKAQESLREPMEEFAVHLRRGRYMERHPAQALYLATTNLCPCGDWVPKKPILCGRSIKRCHSYLEKLSGPLVDRFQILFFTDKQENSKSQINSADLLEELEKIRSWRRELQKVDARFQKKAAHWSLQELSKDLDSFYLQEIFSKALPSKRRELATLRVARSLADLSMSEIILPTHIEEALKFSFLPFDSLKRLGG